MAVILGRKKGKSIELSGNNGQIIYRLPLVYLVYDETGTQSEGTIISTAGLPLVNEPFTIDGVQFTIACKSKRAEQWDNNNKYWTVTCDCDNEPFETGGGGGGDKEGDQPDPTTWIPIVKLEYETIDYVVEEEALASTVLNFANRPYSTPLMRKKLIPCLKFTQYENPNANLETILNFNEVLNDKKYLGQAKGMWMLTIEDCDKGYKNGYLCWRIDYKLRLNKRRLKWVDDKYYTRNILDGIGDLIAIDPDLYSEGHISGWLPIVPQLDYLAKDGTPVKDKDKNQIFGKLNPDGTQVDPADQDNYEKMNYLIHQPYFYYDFSTILRLNQEQ